MTLHLATFPLGAFQANCTIIWRYDGTALVIDPGADGLAICDWMQQRSLTLTAVFLTHGHFDHISGVDAILSRHQCPVFLHAADEPLAFSPFNRMQADYTGMRRTNLLDLTIIDGAPLPLWPEAKILHTPGHSRGSCCLLFDSEKLLVAGDTLFAGGSYGRTDLPGGSWPELEASLRRLATLPGDIRVICGHGDATSISEWRAFSPFQVP